MTYRICLIQGDGIGLEVIPAARDLLEATGLPLLFTEARAGWDAFQEGAALPDETLVAVREARATLFGAVSSPLHRVAGYRSPIVDLRRALDLFACIRPVRSVPTSGARPGIDLVVIRENSEGMYAGRESSDGERATAERVITRAASRRIADFALAYARRHDRRRITIVHKANVLRETCGLFREAALAALAGQSEVAVDELLIDTAAYALARTPERFDLLVTTNLFGDILSDVACAHAGGLGLAASANMGIHNALFEPVHGSAPDIAGRGIANPLATFGAAALLLDYLGEQEAARKVRHAIDDLLRHGPHTPDLGGQATTRDVTRAACDIVAGYARRTEAALSV